ncbi:hypothetical protein HUU59_03740 [bacterium]|nr:hypothetical protein [bacterium]
MERDRQALIGEMIAALGEGAHEFTSTDGRTYLKLEMQELLQEWIPATVEVKRVCGESEGIVVAAPHVSFDNWTEYFANRLAFDLNCGQVLARNFRDEDGGLIPVSIGRHLHVNRPTESKRKGGAERETPRAIAAFHKYRSALHDAGRIMPLALLIELHGHRKHESLEVATSGITESEAKALKDSYEQLASTDLRLPKLAIEPLDTLHYNAKGAKAQGSLSPKVCRYGLHVEIPRVCRENEDARSRFRPVLSEWTNRCIGVLLGG